MQVAKYSCGCEFPLDENGKVIFTPEIEKLPLDCSLTWNLICNGDTKGIFQLESHLGKSLAKQVLPRSIEELSDLISVMRPGCISGDTPIIIRYYEKNNRRMYVKTKLSDIYKNKNKYKTIVSYNESSGKFETNSIKNVIYSGEKIVYKVLYNKHNRTVVNGDGRKCPLLKCTEDHKLLTQRGWIELKNMKLGDRFAIVRFRGTRTSTKNIPGQKGFREICFKNYVQKCVYCDWNEGSLDVNHIDGNRTTDNHPDNLCFLCPNHHRKYTEGNISKVDLIEQRQQYRLPQKEHIDWAEYTGKEEVGVQSVYDITMEAPHHNFIAGYVVVHNCLESVMDGKTLTHHYIDRKHKKDVTTYYHPALESILNKTYGILVYQEQAMQIAQKIAGFNLQEADTLRKAIGKKKPEEMAKVKTLFISKAKELGLVTDEEAIEIFSWIEKSQRYSFNKSHSVAYAVDGYISAYAKAHFPKEFLTAYLVHSREESDFAQEAKELISNAKNYDIEVLPPSIITRNHNFRIYGDNIVCGLSNIKGVGESVLKDIESTIAEVKTILAKDIDKWSWIEFLLYCAFSIRSDAMIAMISTGALSHMGLSRRKMLYELEHVKELTDRDVAFLKTIPGATLLERLKVMALGDIGKGKPLCTKKKKESIEESIKMLENPPYKLEDTAAWISEIEQALLGIPLTCSKVDDCDSSSANCTCKDFLNGYGNPVLIACQIDEVKEHVIKNGMKKGSKMAFLKVSDSYGNLDSVLLFTEQWDKYKDVLIQDNTVMLVGNRDKKNKDTLIVNKVWQI